MSKPYMCLFGCLFVCLCRGSFSESHLLECECHSTSYTSSSRKLSRLVTWLNSQSDVCRLLPCCTLRGKEALAKVGLQPEEMMAKHSINIPLFWGEGKLETSAASVETFVYHSSMVSWQRLKFGSAGRLFSCCWAEPYPREAVKHLFGAGIERIY